jgi:hypothetical protein
MSPHLRSLTATLALAAVATAYVLLQSRGERPAPRLPAPALSTARPAALPAAPPTARVILDRAVVLDLEGHQLVHLEALDRVWRRETSGLGAAIHEAERELSAFMKEAQGSKGASIQKSTAVDGISQLSAELRARRQHHSEAALGCWPTGTSRWPSRGRRSSRGGSMSLQGIERERALEGGVEELSGNGWRRRTGETGRPPP